MAKKVAITQVHTGDRLQGEQQSRTRATAVAVNDVPFMRGRWIRKLALSATPVLVKHNLGHALSGYFATRLSAGAVVFEVSTIQNPDPDNFIPMQATAPVSLDLWVF